MNSLLPPQRTFIVDGNKLLSASYILSKTEEELTTEFVVGHFHANKAHGHDYVSMGLLNVADIAVVKLLSLIIKICIRMEFCQICRKNQGLSQSIKKGKRTVWLTIVQYHQYSGKLFNRLLFN